MALLWCDGFEGYGDSDGSVPQPAGVLADKYEAVLSAGQQDSYSSDTRTDWALRFASGQAYHHMLQPYDLDTTSNTLIAGVAFRPQFQQQHTNPQVWPFLSFKASNGGENAAIIYADGSLVVTGPDLTYLGSTRGTIERQEYHYVEMKVYSHATAGEIHVKVNNCPVLSLTSINTLKQTSYPSTHVRIGANKDIQVSNECRVDDFYICDDAGGINDDFLGSVVVKTLFPASDNVANWSITGNANTSNHYEQVNLLERAEATDYVEDDTITNDDRYGTDSTGRVLDVKGCVTWGALSTTNDSTNNCAFTLTSNGTTVTGDTINPPTSIRIYPHIVEVEPSTNNAWTTGTINSALIGVIVK